MLFDNPFYILQVSPRCKKREIIAQAEELELLDESEGIQNAKEILLQPNNRLQAEVAWLPGVSQANVSKILKTIEDKTNFDTLVERLHLNSLAAANAKHTYLLKILLSGKHPARITQDIVTVGQLLDGIDVPEIKDKVNADRIAAGFPEIIDDLQITDALENHKRSLLLELENALNQLPSELLVSLYTNIANQGTNDGTKLPNVFVEDLIENNYRIGIAHVLEEEKEAISGLEDAVVEALKKGVPVEKLQLASDELRNTVLQYFDFSMPLFLITLGKKEEIEQNIHRFMEGIRYFITRIVTETGNKSIAEEVLRAIYYKFESYPVAEKLLQEDLRIFKRIKKDGTDFLKEKIVYFRDISPGNKLIEISSNEVIFNGRKIPISKIGRISLVYRVGIPVFNISFQDSYRNLTRCDLLCSSNHFHQMMEAVFKTIVPHLTKAMTTTLKNGHFLNFEKFILTDYGVSLINGATFLKKERKFFRWNQLNWRTEHLVLSLEPKEFPSFRITVPYSDENIMILACLLDSYSSGNYGERLSDVLE